MSPGRAVTIPLVQPSAGDRVVAALVALCTVTTLGHAVLLPVTLDALHALAAVLGLVAMGIPALAFCVDKTRSSWIWFDQVGGVLRFERSLPMGGVEVTALQKISAGDRLATVAHEQVDHTGYRWVSYALLLCRANGDVVRLAQGSACDTVQKALSGVLGGVRREVIRERRHVELLLERAQPNNKLDG